MSGPHGADDRRSEVTLLVAFIELTLTAAAHSATSRRVPSHL